MEPIVIIQHDPDDPPGHIVDALISLGLPFRVVDVPAGQSVPSSSREAAALILLGGQMHTHQEAEYPFLRDERLLLEEALRIQSPVLGVCLGAQMVATAAGGRNYFRPRPERGWVDIDVVASDPLLDGLSSPLRVLQWHWQSFTLPPGALRIASRPDGEQVFRVGSRAWAVQFHPEVDVAAVDNWCAEGEEAGELAGEEAARIRAETRARMPDYRQLCFRLVHAFARAAGLLPGEDRAP